MSDHVRSSASASSWTAWMPSGLSRMARCVRGVMTVAYHAASQWLTERDAMGYALGMTTMTAHEFRENYGASDPNELEAMIARGELNMARNVHAAALAARAEAVKLAEQATGRKATAAWRTVEELAAQVDFAARRIEQAVRTLNPGADEATIQRIARAA